MGKAGRQGWQVGRAWALGLGTIFVSWGRGIPWEHSKYLKTILRMKKEILKALRLEVNNFRLGMIMEQPFKYFPVVITRYQTNY